MHPGLDELLAFRDGEASLEVADHVAGCASCRATVAQCSEVQEKLKALPALRPERSVLPLLLEATAVQRAHRRWVAAGWAAACLALAFTLTTAARGGIEAYREAKLARETRALIAESQHLEHDLRSHSTNGRLLSGTTASVIADLEDRIAAVDTRLQTARSRSSNEVVALWQERVYLLSTLADVQTTRTAYVGL
jgi:hypothetical protein